MLFMIFFLISCDAQTMVAHVGQDVEISCNESTTWIKRQLANESLTSTISRNDSILVLKLVQLSDSGIYECAFESTSVKLIVIEGFKNCRENFLKSSPVNCKIEAMIETSVWLNCFDPTGEFNSRNIYQTKKIFSRYDTNMYINIFKNCLCDIQVFSRDGFLYKERFEFILHHPEKNSFHWAVILIVFITANFLIIVILRSSYLCFQIFCPQKLKTSSTPFLKKDLRIVSTK